MQDKFILSFFIATFIVFLLLCPLYYYGVITALNTVYTISVITIVAVILENLI